MIGKDESIRSIESDGNDELIETSRFNESLRLNGVYRGRRASGVSTTSVEAFPQGKMHPERPRSGPGVRLPAPAAVGAGSLTARTGVAQGTSDRSRDRPPGTSCFGPSACRDGTWLVTLPVETRCDVRRIPDFRVFRRGGRPPGAYLGSAAGAGESIEAGVMRQTAGPRSPGQPRPECEDARFFWYGPSFRREMPHPATWMEE